MALFVALAAVLVGAGCTGADVSEAVARVTAGERVEIASREGWVAVDVGDEVPAGARVRTGEAEARLAFASGRVWLAPQGAVVVDDDRVELLRGEALVASSGDLAARWTDVDVSGQGVYRLTPGIAPRLGVYRGEVRVRRPAEMRTVAALREASLSARRLPSSGKPLSYRPDDPWDQILLGEPIAFDGEAERIGRDLAGKYGTAPRPLGFYTGFALTPERTVPTLLEGGGADGPMDADVPREALLRLFMAQAAAQGQTPEALEHAVREVIELRSTGARWGLVAAELGVTRRQLVEVGEAGQARHTAFVAQRAVSPPPTGPDDPAGDETPGPPAPPPPPDAQPGTSPPPPPPSAPPPPPSAPPPPGPAPAPGDTGTGGGGDPSPERQPNPTEPLGQQPPKGLVEAVVDLLLGIP